MSFQPEWADLKLDGAFSNANKCLLYQRRTRYSSELSISVIVTKSCSLNKRDGKT